MRNKYGATKTVRDGIKFDSKKEALMYQNLKLLEKNGNIKDLKLQPEFELQPSFRGKDGKKVRAIKYIADFSFYDNDKKRFRVLDAKGMHTPVFSIKRKMFDYLMIDEGIMLEFEL